MMRDLGGNDNNHNNDNKEMDKEIRGPVDKGFGRTRTGEMLGRPSIFPNWEGLANSDGTPRRTVVRLGDDEEMEGDTVSDTDNEDRGDVGLERDSRPGVGSESRNPGFEVRIPNRTDLQDYQEYPTRHQ